MTGPSYTRPDLERLRDSPLVKRPDNLPPIDQWIDVPNEPNQRRLRTAQGGLQIGKGDENEHPLKRPTLYETRHLSRHSNGGIGDDSILGPKSAFATASAARNLSKNAAPDPQDHSKGRIGGRDRLLRDVDGKEREFPRSRDPLNGREVTKDGRPSGRYNNPFMKDMPVESDGDTATRKNGIGRGKIDQPWFRDTKTTDQESATKRLDRQDRNNEREFGGERRWRDNERRNDKRITTQEQQEQPPQWIGGSLEDEASIGHTQADLEKWKERMRAGTSLATESSGLATNKTEEKPSVASIPTSVPTPDGGSENFFGLWGDAKEEKKQENTIATSTREKSSRFKKLWEPSPLQSSPPEEAIPSTMSPEVAKPSVEDQDGFQRMMQMLRMGGGNSTQVQASQSTNHTQSRVRQDTRSSGEREFEHSNSPTSSGPTSSTQMPVLQNVPPSQPLGIQRETPNRIGDSEFLLNLMQPKQIQQQHQRSPFTEGQIYGQSYQNQRDTNDINSLLSQFTTKSQRPPPGFSNDGAFNNNSHVDMQSQFSDHQSIKSERQHLPETLDMAAYRHAPTPGSHRPNAVIDGMDDPARLQQHRPSEMQSQVRQKVHPPQHPPQVQQHAHFDQNQHHFHTGRSASPPHQPWPPGVSNRAHPQLTHDNVAAPPGFNNIGLSSRDNTAPPPGFIRGPAPPGFYPQQQQQPHMRGPPPQGQGPIPQMHPPGFYGGPLQNLPMPFAGPPVQQGQVPGQMRLSQQLPQGLGVQQPGPGAGAGYGGWR